MLTFKNQNENKKRDKGQTARARGFRTWVAADAAGALGGAIGAGIDSYSSTAKVNWKSVGAWALGGAIGASCVGPIGKVLTKVFG